MFIDEVLKKLKIEDVAAPFTVTLIGRGYAVASGVKAVLLTDRSTVKLRLKKGVAVVSGENLELVEIGGGDVYVRGDIANVALE